MSTKLIRQLVRETILSEASGEESQKAVKIDPIVMMPNLADAGAKIVDYQSLAAGKVVDIMQCKETSCSEWAANIIDPSYFFDVVLGNAWHAHNAGYPVKFSAYADTNKYDKASAALFSAMNALNPFEDKTRIMGEPFKTRAKNISEGLANTFDLKSNLAQLQIGDVVGMFHKNSSHYPDAFFEGAADFNLDNGKSVGNTGPSVFVKETDEPWNKAMLGQKLNFVVKTPFGMNTHLGIVGAMYNEKPVIFHNVGGKVTAQLAKFMTAGYGAKDKIVWAKQAPDA